MADFARTCSQSPLDLAVCDAERLPPGKTGSAAVKAGPIYLKSDGKWANSSGAAANAAAKVHGWALKNYAANSPIDPYKSPTMPWGPVDATPGAPLYLSATAGELDTAATTGGTVPVAFVCGVRTNESTPHAMISTTRVF